jgi:hypothetical protein
MAFYSHRLLFAERPHIGKQNLIHGEYITRLLLALLAVSDFVLHETRSSIRSD